MSVDEIRRALGDEADEQAAKVLRAYLFSNAMSAIEDDDDYFEPLDLEGYD